MEDSNIQEENEAACYVRMARKFSDLSYQDVYMIDLRSNKFIYMSDQALKRYGITKAALIDEGGGRIFCSIRDGEGCGHGNKSF